MFASWCRRSAVRRLLPQISDACAALVSAGERNAGGDQSCCGGASARDHSVRHDFARDVVTMMVMRVSTIVQSAELAWRSPPRLSRCRLVFPDDALTGELAHNAA